jgi:hypothetical protein
MDPPDAPLSNLNSNLGVHCHGLADLLDRIRLKGGLKEKKPGIFYRKSKAFRMGGASFGNRSSPRQSDITTLPPSGAGSAMPAPAGQKQAKTGRLGERCGVLPAGQEWHP